MSTAQQQATEKALSERDHLYTRYRQAKRREFERLCGEHADGERLRKFRATLNHFGIDDSDEMVSYVTKAARGWLGATSPEVRVEALAQISERIMQIRAKAGLVPLDDPLPGEEEDVYRICKRELGL